MNSVKAERGRQVRAEVIGPASADTRASDLPEAFVELGLEFAWATIWAGEAIPVKTRRLVTMALLAAQNRQRELAMHMKAALERDCTAEEIEEICMHVTCYCGFPTAADALRTLAEVARGALPPGGD